MELGSAALGDTPMLVVTGAIDEGTCGVLQAALDQRFAAGHNIIFLDLSNVTHMDGAGLSVIVAGVGALHGRGWLGMIGANAAIRGLLESEGLLVHPNVLIFETRQAALAITRERQST